MANYNAIDWTEFKAAVALVTDVTDTITLTAGGTYILDAGANAINASFTVVGAQSVIEGNALGYLRITGGTQVWGSCTFQGSSGSGVLVDCTSADATVSFSSCAFNSNATNGLAVNSGAANDTAVTATDCTATDNADDGFNVHQTVGGTAIMTLVRCTATDNGSGASDQSVTGHEGANITATDCTFSGATSSEFYMGASSSGTYIFTNCTFTGKSDASSPCFGGTGTAVVTLTGCTITNGNAAKNTFYADGGTYTLTDCTLAGPAYYTLYTLGTSAVTVTATRCRISNTAASAAAADNALVWAANGGTVHLRECVLDHNAETADRPVLETYTTTTAAVINVFGGTINDNSFQSVSLVRGTSAINIVGAKIILNAAATNRLTSSAVFRLSTTGTQRLRGNYITAVSASGANSGNYYIVDAAAEAGSVAPVMECVANVFDFPKFFASGDSWYALLVSAYSSGIFAGNEIYGDGAVLCGTSSSSNKMAIVGNVFHNLLVGVTVTNDNQYSTFAGSGANVFSSCGTNVSGGTAALANGDQVMSYHGAGRYINDRSWRNAHKRIGGGT